MKNNLETYLRWKEMLAAKGKTPTDMVEVSRSLGMSDDYIKNLQAIIDEMEHQLAVRRP